MDAHSLWLFSAMVFGVVVLPGLDMAYVMASALTGGRRAGLAATAGVVIGGACHVVMAAFGLMAVLRLVPAAFNVVLLAGAAYIAWIGWGLLRSRATFAAPRRGPARSVWGTFGSGIATCLLNPKAYLFMLAVFPQFLPPGQGAVAQRALVLWAIIAIAQATVYGGMALAGDRVRRWLARRPGAEVGLSRGVGLLLLAMACITGLQGWHGM